MSPVWLWVGSEWRRRIGSLVGLALLIGVAGGATLVAWAGARRTASSFDRRLEQEQGSNIDILSFPPLAGPGVEVLEQIAAIPGVTGALSMDFAFVRLDDNGLEYFAPILTGEAGHDRWRPQLVRGRRPDANVASEVAINEEMARYLDIGVGDQRQLETINAPILNRVRFDPNVTPHGPTIPVTIVGIYRTAEDISDRPEPALMPSAGLIRDFGGEFSHCQCRIGVRADPAQIDTVMQRLREIVGNEPIIQPFDNFASRIDNTIAVQTAALYAFMSAALLAGLAVVAQAMLRHASTQATETNARAALGMTREQLLTGSVLSVAPAIVGGAIIAIVSAVALSPLLPIGVAGRAEPDPGVRIDALVLGLGGAAILLATTAGAAGAAWWLHRSHAHRIDTVAPRHVSRVAMVVGAIGPSVRLGVGMAVDRRRGAMAARSAMVGMALAIAGVLGAFGFVHAIDQLFATPAAYGADYDALVAGVPGEDFLPRSDLGESLALLIDDPAIESAALLTFPASGDNTITGPTGVAQLLDPNAFDNRKGSIPLTIVEGRAPTSADEVVIGERALADLDTRVGDYVDIAAGERSLRFHVVGVVLFPDVDEVDYSVVLTSDGLSLIGAAAGVPNDVQGVVVRFTQGVDKASEFARLQQLFPTIERPRAPSAVLNLHEIGPLPYYLAAFLVALGAGAMVHALVMTATRRRRDLAVCRAIGFIPRQVVSALGAHAVATTLIGLVVGIPFGFAIGRQVFALVARRANVLADFPVPFGLAMLVAPAAIVIALAIAVAPAAVAARVSPADILRAE